MHQRIQVGRACLWFLFLIYCNQAIAQKVQPVTPASHGNIVYLSDILPARLNDGTATPRDLDREWSIRSISVGQKKFAKSISFGWISWGGNVAFDIQDFDYFEAELVVLDPKSDGTINGVFSVIGNNKRLLPTIPGEQDYNTPYHILVPIKNMSTLNLKWSCQVSPQVVWWANARLIKGKPPIEKPASQPLPTPGTGEESRKAGENGSKVLRLDADKFKELMEDIKKQIAEDPEYSKAKPTLAVAAFKLISKPGEELATANADSVRENLTTALVKAKVADVVERGQLDKALKELHIGLSDTFDSENAQQLGKIVHARTILIGSISDQGTYVVVNVRLIDTQTGLVRIAASTEIHQ